MRPCPKNPNGQRWHLRTGPRCGNCGDYFPTIGLSKEVAAEQNAQRRGAMLHEEYMGLRQLLEQVLCESDHGDRLSEETRAELAKVIR